MKVTYKNSEPVHSFEWNETNGVFTCTLSDIVIDYPESTCMVFNLPGSSVKLICGAGNKINIGNLGMITSKGYNNIHAGFGLNFSGGNSCIIHAGNFCTIHAGENTVMSLLSDCSILVGNESVVERRDAKENFLAPSGTKFLLNNYRIKGYKLI